MVNFFPTARGPSRQVHYKKFSENSPKCYDNSFFFFFSNSVEDMLVSPVHQASPIATGLVNGAAVKAQDIT